MNRMLTAVPIFCAVVLTSCVPPDPAPTSVEASRSHSDGPPLTVLSAPPPPAPCLVLPGTVTRTSPPTITDQPPVYTLGENEDVDARTAKFLVNDPMTDQSGGFFRIARVRSATNSINSVCWSGGEILGQYAPSTLWGTWLNDQTHLRDHGMHDKYGQLGGVSGYASGIKIENVFIFNYGDGISFDAGTDYATNKDFTIRNVHMNYIRDDCIEDDSYLGGMIDSVFLDGCYSGVSAQSSRSAVPSHIITMMHSLVRLQSMDVVYKYSPNVPHDSSQPGPLHNWFWKWSPNAPKLKLYNNVFRVDSWRLGAVTDRLVPTEDMFYNQDAASCENNTIVWLGSGSFPEALPFPTHQNPPCFTVVYDVATWDNAVTDWQNKHAALAASGTAKPIVSMFPARQPYYWTTPTPNYRGTQTVIATAVDDRAMFNVRFQIDNKDIGTVNQAASIGDGSTGPTKYNLSWDSRYYADATLVANGSHTLKAIARDDQNQETTSTGVPVTVSNPVASFTFSCTQLACSFTSTSTDPNGAIASYAWAFGDGSTSTVQNPSHTYATGGTYTVTLTVTGNGGAASAPKSSPVTVSAPPPPPLAPPTNCTIQKQPPTGNPVYLKVTWTNGDPTASTEVWIERDGIWTLKSTEPPGSSAYFYSMGNPPQTGLFYGRVRHVKAGYVSSGYCVTGSTSWP